MVSNAVTDPAALALLSNGDYLAVSPSAVVEFNSTGALQPTVTVSTVQAAVLIVLKPRIKVNGIRSQWSAWGEFSM
jgi:hypothetical protein